MASKIDDPIKQQAILTQCDQLERIIPQLIRATKAYLEKPKDPARLATLNDINNQLAQISAQLHLATLNANMDDSQQALLDALNAGDTQRAGNIRFAEK